MSKTAVKPVLVRDVLSDGKKYYSISLRLWVGSKTKTIRLGTVWGKSKEEAAKTWARVNLMKSHEYKMSQWIQKDESYEWLRPFIDEFAGGLPDVVVSIAGPNAHSGSGHASFIPETRGGKWKTYANFKFDVTIEKE